MSKENLRSSQSNLTQSKSNLLGSKSNLSARSFSGSLKNIKVKEAPPPAPVPNTGNDQPVAPSIIYENTYKTKPDRK